MPGSHRSSNSVDTVVQCGPITLELTAETEPLRTRARAVLAAFTAHWGAAGPPTRVELRMTSTPADMGAGRVLSCSDLRVDHTSAGLMATCRSGGFGHYDPARRSWVLHIHKLVEPPRLPASDPDAPQEVWLGDSVEDLLELVLTTAWREVGWIPLHAGAVVDEDRCALLTAPAKGGKTTLTVALLQRGWRTLGDDKTLLALTGNGTPEARGLAPLFNIDPYTASWFPALGNLQRLPPLSRWNDKRRVLIEDVWSNCFAARAVPTHVVAIRRSLDRRPVRIEPLQPIEVLSALLHQTVVPNDPNAAKAILNVLVHTARTLRGVRFELGDDAYSDPGSVDALDALLR